MTKKKPRKNTINSDNNSNEKKKSANSSSTKLKRENTSKSLNKKKKIKKDLKDFDDVNSDNEKKMKLNKVSSKYSIKDEDLKLYKGEIDYNNVSLNNLSETIEELMNKYKKKGYTCVKKGGSEFKFVKGPNIHHVKIMRIRNGLFYFNVSQK